MSDPPGRETRPAESNRRRSFYGTGQTASVEKSRFGRFLDDVSRIAADVSVAALPFLWHVLVSEDVSYFGLKATTLLAWTTMVFVGAALRGGLIRPLATPVRGWVSLSPVLVAVRLVYYNAALAVAAYGGGALAAAVGWPPASFVAAVAVGALAMLSLPRLAEVVAGRIG